LKNDYEINIGSISGKKNAPEIFLKNGNNYIWGLSPLKRPPKRGTKEGIREGGPPI
jgi:hypothetical protein